MVPRSRSSPSFGTMDSIQEKLDAAKAAAWAAGPCVVTEIQEYSKWKAPVHFSCTSGVLWGKLQTVIAGSMATDIDSSLCPYSTNRPFVDNYSTILQSSFRYRVPARRGLWKVEAVFAGRSLLVGYVCHQVDTSGPDLLRRAALVGVSSSNDHGDRDIVCINRYDWARIDYSTAGYHLMMELLKPEKERKDEGTLANSLTPEEKQKNENTLANSQPLNSECWNSDDELSSEDKEDLEDFEEEDERDYMYDKDEEEDDDFISEDEEGYEQDLMSDRYMLVDELGFPQLLQSLREGLKLNSNNYLFRDGATPLPQEPSSSSDAFGVNLGVSDADIELGWMVFQDGELVGFVYDGSYCIHGERHFQCGDTKVEVAREPIPDFEDEGLEGV